MIKTELGMGEKRNSIKLGGPSTTILSVLMLQTLPYQIILARGHSQNKCTKVQFEYSIAGIRYHCPQQIYPKIL
jgi:hypothetical protein